jgi:hypothetical protein
MNAAAAAASLDEPAGGGGDSSSAECTLCPLKEMDMVAVGGGDEKKVGFKLRFLSQMGDKQSLSSA